MGVMIIFITYIRDCCIMGRWLYHDGHRVLTEAVSYVELKLMHLKTEERYIYTIPLDAKVQGMDYASLSLYGHEVLARSG